MIAGAALAQPAPAKTTTTKAEPPALAALHAIDAYAASAEAVVTHCGAADFPQRDEASPHRAKKRRAELALEKVKDKDLHHDLDILLNDIMDFWIQCMGRVTNPKDTGVTKAIAVFHSERELVATEIITGQRGLLHMPS